MQSYRAYILCFTVRTGSSVLCEYLREAGFGAPGEFFQNQIVFNNGENSRAAFREYLAKLQNVRTVNGSFGFKVDWFGFEQLRKDLSSSFGCPLESSIEQILHNPALIFLCRRDKVRQAVSQWKALRTGVWHFYEESQLGTEPDYDFDNIYECFRRLLAEERLWENYFSSRDLRPLRVYYEDFVADPRATLSRIAEYLGSPGTGTVTTAWKPVNRVMANSHTEFCSRRFYEDLSRLKENYSAKDLQFQYVLKKLTQHRKSEWRAERLTYDLFGAGVESSNATVVEGAHFERGRAWHIQPGGTIRLNGTADVVHLVFFKHAWSGLARISANGFSQIIDLYSETPDEVTIDVSSLGEPVSISAMEESNAKAIGREVWLQDVYSPVRATAAKG